MALNHLQFTGFLILCIQNPKWQRLEKEKSFKHMGTCTLKLSLGAFYLVPQNKLFVEWLRSLKKWNFLLTTNNSSEQMGNKKGLLDAEIWRQSELFHCFTALVLSVLCLQIWKPSTCRAMGKAQGFDLWSKLIKQREKETYLIKQKVVC